MSIPVPRAQPRHHRGGQPCRHRRDDPGGLPRPGPAAHRRRRHLLRRLHARPAGSRPTTRSGSPASASARSRRSSWTATTSGSPSGSTAGPSSAPRPRPRSRSRPCSAPCSSRCSRPVAASWRRRARSRSSAPARRTTSSRRSPASPRPPSRSTPTSWRRALTTLADLTRNTPEEFREALDGVSALSANVAARDEQINKLLGNLERVSTVLDERDEDIIALMKDSDVLFRALVAAPRGGPQPAGLDLPPVQGADPPGPAEPRPTSSPR